MRKLTLFFLISAFSVLFFGFTWNLDNVILKGAKQTPATKTDNCTMGLIAYDNNYWYWCYADNNWRRTGYDNTW